MDIEYYICTYKSSSLMSQVDPITILVLGEGKESIGWEGYK